MSYKKVQVNLVYYVKHDGRHKSSLVADGNLTDIPVESVYSGVASLCGTQLLVFIADRKKKKRGLHILESHTLKQRHWRKFTSQQGLNMVILTATFSLLPRRYMVSDIMALYGMKCSMIILEIWDSSCANGSLTPGCARTDIYI